jgi:PAS domain S-box-containing protein
MERRYFEKFFATIALGASSSISLFRSDGLLLAGYSPKEAIGDALAEGDALKSLLTRQEVARIVDRDGAEHLVAAHAVAHYPLIVTVGITSAAALANWRTQALYLGVAAILVALAISAITFVGVRRFQDYAFVARERANRTSNETSRKATELVLRETERVGKLLNKQKVQLDTALENMSQGLVMLDADARMLVCNQRYIEMYGMSPEVVGPGCTLRELIAHRVEIGAFAGNIDETVSMILTAIARGVPSKSSTQLANGRVISVSTRPMAEGGWVATHEDVTEQRRAEREADRTQRFLLTVIENVFSAIIVKDARNLKYVLINRAGEKFYGKRRSDVVGRTSHDLFPKASADMIVAHDEKLLQSDGEVLFDAHMVETPANGRRLVKARRMAIREANGKPQFLLSVIDDVTERAQET